MLAYLIGLAILAYIVFRFAKAYDNLAREMREIRVKCVMDRSADAGADGATGVVMGATKQLAGMVGSFMG